MNFSNTIIASYNFSFGLSVDHRTKSGLYCSPFRSRLNFGDRSKRFDVSNYVLRYISRRLVLNRSRSTCCFDVFNSTKKNMRFQTTFHGADWVSVSLSASKLSISPIKLGMFNSILTIVV